MRGALVNNRPIGCHLARHHPLSPARAHAKRRPRALRFAPTRLRRGMGKREVNGDCTHTRTCVRRWVPSGPNRYQWHRRRTAILFHSDCCFLPCLLHSRAHICSILSGKGLIYASLFFLTILSQREN